MCARVISIRPPTGLYLLTLLMICDVELVSDCQFRFFPFQFLELDFRSDCKLFDNCLLLLSWNVRNQKPHTHVQNFKYLTCLNQAVSLELDLKSNNKCHR